MIVCDQSVSIQYSKLILKITQIAEVDDLFFISELRFSGTVDNPPPITQNVLEWVLPTKKSQLFGPFLKAIF